MLSRRKIAQVVSLTILLLAIAALWLGPYRVYCEGNRPEDEYCAAYKISIAFGHFLHAYGDAVTALATLAIALFTWTLWRSSEKMWIATNKALRHAEQTAERELRAYVHISGGVIKFEPLDTPSWHLTVKNFGQTPAYDVRQWTHIWITEYPLAIKLPRPPADLRMACSILPPGGHEEMHWRKYPAIPANALNLVGTAKGTAFIYGEICYRDAFGKDRITKYRLIYGGETPNRGGFLKPDTEGNEAT